MLDWVCFQVGTFSLLTPKRSLLLSNGGTLASTDDIVICKSVARSAFFRNLADPAAPSNPGARTPNCNIRFFPNGIISIRIECARRALLNSVFRISKYLIIVELKGDLCFEHRLQLLAFLRPES
jgi:hypothetical protein